MIYKEPRLSITLARNDDKIFTSLTDVGDITDDNFSTPGLSNDRNEGGTTPWPFG